VLGTTILYPRRREETVPEPADDAGAVRTAV
jgi:hypothetical protein